VRRAEARAAPTAGNSNANITPMTAITTSNSTNVKARRQRITNLALKEEGASLTAHRNVSDCAYPSTIRSRDGPSRRRQERLKSRRRNVNRLRLHQAAENQLQMPVRMNWNNRHADRQPVASDTAASQRLDEHDGTVATGSICFGLCAAATVVMRFLSNIASVDTLGAGGRQNVIRRLDVIFTSPSQSLRQRVATTA